METTLFYQNVFNFTESPDINFQERINGSFISLCNNSNINVNTSQPNENCTAGSNPREILTKIELHNPFSGVQGKILLTVAFVLSVVVCVENMFTIYVIRYTPSLKTIQNKYILSLASADFLVGVALTELFIFKLCQSDGCQTNIALLHSSIGISMLNLMAIAVDRYVFISRPFLHMRKCTSRFTEIIIVLQWILGLSIGFVPAYLFDLGKGKGCHPFFILHHTLVTCFHLGLFTTCVVVTGILYGLIAKIAKQKGDQRRRANRYVMKTLENSGHGVIGNSGGVSIPISSNKTLCESSNKNDNGIGCCGKIFGCCKNQQTGNDNDLKRKIDEKNDCNRSDTTSCDSQISNLWKKHEIPLSIIIPQDLGKTCQDDNVDEGIGGCTSSESLPKETSSADSNTSSSTENNGHKPLNKPIQTSEIKTTSLQLPSRINSLRWLKQMVMVYGVFVICWTPSQIAALLYLLGMCEKDPILILSWFGVANSALNFYIYAFMNLQFRKALKQKLKRKWWIFECWWAACCCCCCCCCCSKPE